MKRKNIMTVLVLAAVIVICALSPFFASKLLDRTDVGRIQTDRTPTRESQEELSLAEEIRIYYEPEGVVESRPDDLAEGTKAEFEKYNPRIYGIVRNEVSGLQWDQLLSEVADQIFEEESAWMGQMYTYADAGGSYVTVWEVTIQSSVYVDMQILADSWRIFWMIVEGSGDFQVLSDPAVMTSFRERWGEYLGLKLEGTDGSYVLYRDEKGKQVIYAIEYGTDYFSIYPMVDQETDKGEIQDESE